MSKIPLFVVAADTHLAVNAWSKYKEIKNDSFYSFSQIIDICINYSVPLVLAGDVFDKRLPDNITIMNFLQEIKRLRVIPNCQNKVLFIQGQHEYHPTTPWVSVLTDSITGLCSQHLNNRSAVIGSRLIKIIGLDWTPKSEVSRKLTDINNADNEYPILIMHQSWKELMGEALGNYDIAECSLDLIKPSTKLVITGDFHRTVSIKKNRTTLLSPGSTCMQSIDENPLKYCCLVFDDLSVKLIPLKTRQCISIEINSQDDLNEFLNNSRYIEEVLTPQHNVPEDIATNILHVKTYPDVSDVFSTIYNYLKNRAHLIMTTLTRKPEIKHITKEIRSKCTSIEEGLKILIQPNTDLYCDLSSLLTSIEPKETLESIHKNFLERHCL